MQNQLTKQNRPRLIKGVILKCIDGRWEDGDGLPPPNEMLVVGKTRALQCWKGGEVLDTIIEQPGEPLSDVDKLNEQIPQQDWEPDKFNPGKLRAPWQLNFVIYLLDPESANTFTFLNTTVGARIAWERLSDKIDWMRKLRGANAFPIVRLENRPMKTKIAGVTKLRPEFTPIDWREFGGSENGSAGITQTTAPQIEHKPTPPLEQPSPPKKRKKTAVGKPVVPPTTAEELKDEIPF
jgi:hypothetical protein